MLLRPQQIVGAASRLPKSIHRLSWCCRRNRIIGPAIRLAHRSVRTAVGTAADADTSLPPFGFMAALRLPGAALTGSSVQPVLPQPFASRFLPAVRVGGPDVAPTSLAARTLLQMHCLACTGYPTTNIGTLVPPRSGLVAIGPSIAILACGGGPNVSLFWSLFRSWSCPVPVLCCFTSTSARWAVSSSCRGRYRGGDAFPHSLVYNKLNRCGYAPGIPPIAFTVNGPPVRLPHVIEHPAVAGNGSTKHNS